MCDLPGKILNLNTNWKFRFARCVSRKKKTFVVYHNVTVFLLVVFENFQNLSLKCLWDGSGVGCNVAQPNPPLREVGWASVHWRALGPSARIFWGELGYATLLSTPEPSHKHFSERFWKFSKTTSKKNRYFVVYHKGLFLVGNATCRPIKKYETRNVYRNSISYYQRWIVAVLAFCIRAATYWVTVLSPYKYNHNGPQKSKGLKERRLVLQRETRKAVCTFWVLGIFIMIVGIDVHWAISLRYTAR